MNTAVETPSTAVQTPLGRLAHRIAHDLSREELVELSAQLLAAIGKGKPPLGRPPAIDARELKRRVELIVNRAEHAEYGKPLCRFCGRKQAGDYRLRDHLKRSHAAEVAELPASEFD